MDEITKASVLYDITGIMNDHSLSADQALYLMCETENINYVLGIADINSLYNKGLLVKGKVNQTLLFHLKAPKQLTLDLNSTSTPNSTAFTLQIAHKIEKTFVIDKFLTDDERKRLADKYFKGDLSVARYFIIFKSLFPVKSKTKNIKWNTKFGFIYDGIGLWDDSLRVAKKFHDIYRKLDMGIFLEATYRKVKDSIDFEQERCFMTKPYKFLTGFDSYYMDVKDTIVLRETKKTKDPSVNIDKLKV